jgi:hypothetical protein
MLPAAPGVLRVLESKEEDSKTAVAQQTAAAEASSALDAAIGAKAVEEPLYVGRP